MKYLRLRSHVIDQLCGNYTSLHIPHSLPIAEPTVHSIRYSSKQTNLVVFCWANWQLTIHSKVGTCKTGTCVTALYKGLPEQSTNCPCKTGTRAMADCHMTGGQQHSKIATLEDHTTPAQGSHMLRFNRSQTTGD